MSNIVIVSPDMASSVGCVASNHARELARWHRVWLVGAEADRRHIPGVVPIPVRPQNWNWLRRFCHVPNELGFVYAVRRKLASVCRTTHVDIVWCHGHSMAMWMSRLRSRFPFKIIMTVHGDIHERPAGTYDSLLTEYYRAVTSRAYRSSDRIHVLAPQMACWAERSGALTGRVFSVPNGIDPVEIGLESFRPRTAESFMQSGVFRVLYVGTLTRPKGVDVLLRACSIMRSASDGGIALQIVGTGPEEGRLRLLASKLGIADSVEFCGRGVRREMGQHYLASDVLCVPSLVMFSQRLCWRLRSADCRSWRRGRGAFPP